MQPRSAAGNSTKSNGIGARQELSQEDEALARCLVNARLDARILDEFPGLLPTSIEQAYSVQAASIAQWPDDVAGWKVARLSPNDRDRFARERLAGPIYRSTIRTVESQSATTAQVFDGGFAAIEAEIILELGRDIGPDVNSGSNEDLASVVSNAYCGAEIASSPMPFVTDLGAMSIISDIGTNAGAIVGPEIVDFLELPADTLAASVSVDGELVGEANPGAITGTPFDALHFLIDHCAANGIALVKGALISTGMITGVHEVSVGSRARVDFGMPGWFDVEFEPIQGR